MPDSNFIFFIATKKTKQKKALRCAGHVLFGRSATSIQVVLIDQEFALPPQDPRLLRPSPFVEGCSGRHAFRLFPCKSHRKGGPPATGRLLEDCRYFMSRKTGKGDALRKEKAFLHTFVAGQKYGVGRDATRRFCLSKKHGYQIHNLSP